MTEKLLQSVTQEVGAKRSILFYASGVVAYAMAVVMWRSIEQTNELSVALIFIKALIILSTGFWGCLSFASFSYSISKKNGVLIGSLVFITLGALSKYIHHQMSDLSIFGSALRAIAILGVTGGLLGWLVAWQTKSIS